MRRTALAVVAVAALVAVAAASSRAPAVAVPQAAKAPAKSGPLLAVVPGDRGPVLGRADKRALWIGRRSPRLRIFNSMAGWAYSPDHDRLALATESPRAGPRLQFVNPYSLVRSGITRLGSGHVVALAWGKDVSVVVDRDCCPASFDVVAVDTATTKIRRRTKLPNTLLQSARIGGTLVLLAAPATGIGATTIVVVGPAGDVRSIELSQIAAGMEHSQPFDGGDPDFTKFRQNIPGLAVDAATNRAFVVPAAGEVAEISLGDLTVSYHAVAQPVSLLGRVHDWLEAKATAKGMNGPMRKARWLGSGVLAVTGADEAMFKDANGQPRMTWAPAGLRLIDTNTWGSKLIDRGADEFTVDGASLLATGSRWDSRDEASATGMGLAAYGFDGARRLSVLSGRRLWVALAFRGRAYVWDDLTLRVVDLASGTVKSRLRPLPQLLIGDGST